MTTGTPSGASPLRALAAPPRRLGLFDIVCIGVNAIVGSGVFAAPDDMHRAMGAWSPFGFLLCAALLLPVALCFAELSGRFRETGGTYLYAQRAFGDRVGYLVGWFCYVNTFVSWAANATLFVELAGVKSPLVARLAASGAVLALGAVNVIGVKPGAWLVNAVVIGKLSAIACFVAVAIGALDPSRFGGALPLGLAGVGQGIYVALFPLQGFEVTPIAAGETKDPERTVPRATVLSLVFAAALFALVQATLVGTYAGLAADSRRPLVEAARAIAPWLGVLVLAGSVVSVGGFTAGSALGAPRYAQAIAADGLLPRALARLHPRFATPYLAIAVTTAVTAMLAAGFNYKQLVGMSNITVIVQYAFTCLAVPVLRKKLGASAGYKLPWGAALPVLGTLGALALLGGTEKAEVGFAVGSLVLGAIVWALHKRSEAAEAATRGESRDGQGEDA